MIVIMHLLAVQKQQQNDSCQRQLKRAVYMHDLLVVYGLADVMQLLPVCHSFVPIVTWHTSV